jgi:hypothetical protein
MNKPLDNPVVLLIVGILALFILSRLLRFFLAIFWIIPLGFIIAFAVSPSFREDTRRFFDRVLKR